MSEETIKKEKKKSRCVLTAAVLTAFAGIAAVGLFSLYALRYLGSLPEVMPYDSAVMSYGKADVITMGTAEGFSASLAVGPDDLALEGVELSQPVCAGLFSVSDNTLLFAKDIYSRIYPASITKLMTAILAFEYADESQMVTIQPSDVALEEGSQVIGLQAGDQVLMGDLIKAMMVHSGNDAAQAIARVVGGTQSRFVDMMNEEAGKIGATGTHFVNPTGLHDEDHYTTVYDIYLMLKKAVTYGNFLNITQMPLFQISYTNAAGEAVTKTLYGTDHYITGEDQPPRGVSVLGGKTGTTSAAGSCLAIFSQNEYGELYISIVVRAGGKQSLYRDMNTLLSQL